jgi:multidrug efflux pump subunit AcrA (membrane-fusion protein)
LQNPRLPSRKAEVTRSQAQEYRQRELLKNGHTTQVAYDQALKTFKTAQAQLDAARARQIQASENLGYTDLKADNDGVITAIGADPGQVVSAGQMVVRLAQPGSALFQKDGKPAVWLVEKDKTVRLKPITVQRYQGDSVVVGDGLAQGDVVVTAGVQKLLPGQKVALMDASTVR